MKFEVEIKPKKDNSSGTAWIVFAIIVIVLGLMSMSK